MTNNQKKALYESIMCDVAKIVKKKLNEQVVPTGIFDLDDELNKYEAADQFGIKNFEQAIATVDISEQNNYAKLIVMINYLNEHIKTDKDFETFLNNCKLYAMTPTIYDNKTYCRDRDKAARRCEPLPNPDNYIKTKSKSKINVPTGKILITIDDKNFKKEIPMTLYYMLIVQILFCGTLNNIDILLKSSQQITKIRKLIMNKYISDDMYELITDFKTFKTTESFMKFAKEYLPYEV